MEFRISTWIYRLDRTLRSILNDIRGPIHRAEMHSREIFSDHADTEELCAREDRDDRGEECETRHRGTLQQNSQENEKKNRNPE